MGFRPNVTAIVWEMKNGSIVVGISYFLIGNSVVQSCKDEPKKKEKNYYHLQVKRKKGCTSSGWVHCKRAPTSRDPVLPDLVPCHSRSTH
jgi:hypothetical protein